MAQLPFLGNRPVTENRPLRMSPHSRRIVPSALSRRIRILFVCMIREGDPSTGRIPPVPHKPAGHRVVEDDASPVPSRIVPESGAPPLPHRDFGATPRIDICPEPHLSLGRLKK